MTKIVITSDDDDDETIAEAIAYLEKLNDYNKKEVD